MDVRLKKIAMSATGVAGMLFSANGLAQTWTNCKFYKNLEGLNVSIKKVDQNRVPGGLDQVCFESIDLPSDDYLDGFAHGCFVSEDEEEPLAKNAKEFKKLLVKVEDYFKDSDDPCVKQDLGRRASTGYGDGATFWTHGAKSAEEVFNERFVNYIERAARD